MPLPDTTVSCKSPGTRQRTTNTKQLVFSLDAH